MRDYYEEYYPEKIAYCTYERDIDEKNQEISKLQDEIYEKDKLIEKLENELEELKNEKNN
jgi:predicted RNase H-like nuclease (RuvC/YqgF family)